MSTFTVPVVEYTLEKHPNADSLSIATIKGWQCIVKTEDFPQPQGLAVYVPIQAIADKNHELLGFLEGKKVRTIKLRKAISQGVLLPMHQVEKYLVDHKRWTKPLQIGDDLADLLDIRAWEPPIKNSMGGFAGASGAKRRQVVHPDFVKYTDLEHLKNHTDAISYGEHVVITEKLHGTSARFGLINGEYYVGSRNVNLHTKPFFNGSERFVRVAEKLPTFLSYPICKMFKSLRLGGLLRYEIPALTVWHFAFKKHNLEEKLKAISQAFGGVNVVLFGEIVGENIQDLHYGHKEPHFYAYDIRLGHEGNYTNPLKFLTICKVFEIENVPVLKIGTFEENDLLLRNGKDTISSSHVREGFVIEPSEPRHSHFLGRCILKVIGEEYYLRKDAEDYANE